MFYVRTICTKIFNMFNKVNDNLIINIIDFYTT